MAFDPVRSSPTMMIRILLCLLVSLGTSACKRDPKPPGGFVPSAIDPTVATHLGDSTRFIWDGPGAVQTGVTPGAIRRELSSVLRGVVRGADGVGLSDVRVTLLGGGKYGQTLTRAKGEFDFVVNGGTLVTLQMEKAGFLPSQRQIRTTPLEFAAPIDVVLLTEAPATALTLGGPAQWVDGRVESDKDGSRTLSLFVPAGTSATFVLPTGTTAAPSEVHFRATEYTVGDIGPRAMPADLPIDSGYTYATELSFDEARAQSALRIDFSQTIYSYVDNFLGLNVGTTVPNGSYDRQRGVWVPEDSGRVITILGATAGLADIDSNGDGVADDELALSLDERTLLATHRTVGTSLWRMPMKHFSDWNLSRRAGPGAVLPLEPTDLGEKKKERDCGRGGSYIECENRVLSEGIAIPGTPYFLVYRSDRVPGRKIAYDVRIPLTPSTIPSVLKRVELEVMVAGQKHVSSFAPEPNLSTTFTWNGRDVYDRVVIGTQPITVRVGFTYTATYSETSTFGDQPSNVSVSTNDARTELTFWIEARGSIGAWAARTAGFGHWTLSNHHGYDVSSHVVEYGDGRRRVTDQVGKTIKTVAGLATSMASENVPAKTATFGIVTGVVFGPDGSIYFSDESENRVRRIDADGVLTTFAGTGAKGFAGDGGSARDAELDAPAGVALGPDNTVYISDRGNRRIRAVAPDGTIRTVAGNGAPDFGGDGGPGIAAGLSPRQITAAPDGTIYIADSENHRIRRLRTNGNIDTLAGDGSNSTLSFPQAVAVCPTGSIFVTDSQNSRIRGVINGVFQTVAGTGFPGDSGDGGPAIDAQLESPGGIACGPNGTLYFTQRGRIRAISPTGIVETVAGSGITGDGGEDGPALQAQFFEPSTLAVSASGDLLIGDSFRHRIKRISTPLPGLGLTDIVIATDEGNELFVFDSKGHHQKTLDGWTGALNLQFEYDTDGYVIGIVDAAGKRTQIKRVGERAEKIISPFGVETTLSIDSSTYLRKVTHATGEVLALDYKDAGGLLSGATDPRGHQSTFLYEPNGLLLADVDAKAASQTLMSIDESTVGYQSPLGRSIVMSRVSTPTSETRTVTGIDGVAVVSVLDASGTQTTTYPEGTVVSQKLGPEPRFGMAAPIPTQQVVKLPSGKHLSLSMSRTVALASDSDPLSVTTIEDVVTRNGKAWKRVYDGATRTLTTTTPMGRTIVASLNAQGWLTKISVPKLADGAFGYDTDGRLASFTQATRAWTFGYDAANFFSSAQGPLATKLSLTNDKIGRVESFTVPGGTTYGYGWDDSSNLISTTMPSGASYGYEYDAVDLPAKATEPMVAEGATSSSFGFDLDRNATSFTQADGSTITLGYDAKGRLEAIGSAADAITVGYDSVSRVSTLSGAGQAIVVSYDGATPLATEWSGAISGSVSYALNDDFRLGEERVNAGTPISFGYDDDGLFTSVGALTIARDSQNGATTGTTLDATTDTITYDPFGAPATSTGKHSTTTQLSYVWTYDDLGRIKTQTEELLGETHTDEYEYDAASQLKTWKRDGTNVAAYTYDSNGNRTTNGATLDAQDRLLSDTTATYAHDFLGRRTSRTAAGATTTYRWDVYSRLVGIDLPTGQKITNVFDPLGRIIARRVDGTLTEGFLYGDVLGPIAQLDSTGAVKSRFVYGTRSESPEYVERDGTRYRVWHDIRGSVRLVVDATTGTVAQRLDYDAWGRITNDTNPGFQPFGYAGGLYDARTGLTHFGVRDYDPETGRWLSKDPLGRVAEPNAYRYVGNDPINFIDPTGLSKATFFSNFLDGYANARTGGFLLLFDQQVVAEGAVEPCMNPNSAGFKLGELVGTMQDLIPGRGGGVGVLAGGGPKVGSIPKAPTGRGSVPPSARDPKRLFTPAERAAQREAQGGVCATGCGTKIDGSNSRGHHIDRHADGGGTIPGNHAEVCIDCHDLIHAK